MATIAGVDIGNNSTEVAIARTDGKGDIQVLSSALVRTVGIKGTLQNILGVRDVLGRANQFLARKADFAYYVVAGVVLDLKALQATEFPWELGR